MNSIFLESDLNYIFRPQQIEFTSENVNPIIINCLNSSSKHSFFHFLLHLQKPNKTFLEKVRKTGFSEIDIQKQLTTPGSRFYPEFVDDLESLSKHTEVSKFELFKEANGNIRLIGKADLLLFARGAGTNAVVPLSELTNEQLTEIYKRLNRGYQVNHLKVNELPSTPHFMIILKPIKRGYKFITAFPGEVAMPMPHRGMKPSLYKACKQFWDQHVILND